MAAIPAFNVLRATGRKIVELVGKDQTTIRTGLNEILSKANQEALRDEHQTLVANFPKGLPSQEAPKFNLVLTTILCNLDKLTQVAVEDSELSELVNSCKSLVEGQRL